MEQGRKGTLPNNGGPYNYILAVIARSADALRQMERNLERVRSTRCVAKHILKSKKWSMNKLLNNNEDLKTRFV